MHLLCQAGTGAAEQLHQHSLEDVGLPAAAAAGEAQLPHTVSEPAADEPEAEKKGRNTIQPGQAKGRAKATGRAAAAKGRRDQANAPSSSAEAVPAAEAAPVQPEQQQTEPPAAIARAQHSEYSFPDTAPDDIPPVRIERAAAKATRLASASVAQEEPEEGSDNPPKIAAGRRKKADQSKAAGSKARKGKAATPRVGVGKSGTAAGELVEAEGPSEPDEPDEGPEKGPERAIRQGRRTAKAAQPGAEAAPASARPKRAAKKAAAAEEAAAKEHSLTDVPDQADQAADEAAVQGEADPEDPPKDRSAGPVRGKKTPVPGKGKAGQRGKAEARTDAAADTEVPQATHSVSRATRAAQQKGEDPKQADAGPASAAQQAKRGKRKAPVAAPKKEAEETGPELTDSSAKQFAGLTESQAAADTLAKVSGFTKCSASQLWLSW